jgi:hypothetical protein
MTREHFIRHPSNLDNVANVTTCAILVGKKRGTTMSQKARELDFNVNMSLDDAWTKAFAYWKNQKVRTNPPAMTNLPDGSRQMDITQLMSFTSNGQSYRLIFKSAGEGTNVHVWVTLTFGYGMQWAKPLTVIQKLAKELGYSQKFKWLN